MKKVLLVSKSFSPDQSVSSFRATRIAKALQEYDWEPSVLTLSDGDAEEALTNIHVERHDLPFAEVPPSKDAGIRWLPILLKRTSMLIKNENFDLLYITGPPFPIFVLGPFIKSITGVPYVLDLRDPWSIGLKERDDSIFEKVFELLTIFGEPITFHYTDQIIVNSPVMADQYSEKYNKTKYNISKENLNSIRNGFERQDLVSRGHKERSFGEFQLIYPGKFRTSMEDVMEGFRYFSREVSGGARFIHYGDMQGQYSGTVRKTVSRLRIEDNVEFRGFVNRDVVLSSLDRANVGIAVTREKDLTHVPMKIYDYIARDLPIIVIDDTNGAAARLVKQFKNGYAVSHGDSDSVLDVLLQLYQKRTSHLGDYRTRSKFSMSNRVSEVVDVFERSID